MLEILIVNLLICERTVPINFSNLEQIYSKILVGVFCLTFLFFISVLAQRGFFKDSTFVNYLKYLLYWKEPEYAKFLKYPMCLYFLDLLQYEHFRRELVNAQCAKFIDDQQILLWQHYTRRRSRLLTSSASNGNTEQNSSISNSSSNGHLNSKIS